MSKSIRGLGVLGLALAALLACPPPGRSQEAPPDRLPPPPTQDATAAGPVEVQTRGPIHEAFAQPLAQAPQPGPVVPKQPPEPIAEVPPDQRPEGDNVQWIPGYWAWDSTRNDFLWVSGCWRVVPPGRKWVPGHWAQAEGGWQWVAGFWADAAQQDVPYQQPPPASLDYGPATPAPDDNSFYVPGCWQLRDSRYLWRPGYWTEGQPGYVWCPDHYSYTPAGSVFVNGYWDYDLPDRGLLFAPVSFNSPVWQNPGWSYTPNYCVNTPDLLSSLFVGPGNCGYYFGDYYGPNCQGLGFQPWCLYGDRNYDPLFAYNRWANRGDPGWYGGLRDNYYGRLRGDLPRPPRSLAAQRDLLRNGRFGGARGLRTVAPLGQVHGNHLRLTGVDRGQFQQQRRGAEGFRAVSRNRQAVERAGNFRGGRPSALSLAGVPVAAGRGGPAGRVGAPGAALRGAPERASRAAAPGFAPGSRGPAVGGYRGPAYRAATLPSRGGQPGFRPSSGYRGTPGPVARGYAGGRPGAFAPAAAYRQARPAVRYAPQRTAAAYRQPAPARSRFSAPARSYRPPAAARAPARSFARPAYHAPAFRGGGRPAPAFRGGSGGRRSAPSFHGGGGHGGGGGGHGGGRHR